MMGDVIRGRSLYLSFLSGAVNAEFRRGMPRKVFLIFEKRIRKQPNASFEEKAWVARKLPIDDPDTKVTPPTRVA